MKKLIAAAALLAMTACGGSRNDLPLEGNTWKLTSMEGIPAEAIDAEEENFVLLFDGEELLVAGRTNCNRFFGSYVAEEDGGLVFGDLGMTRMACPDMEYEDLFAQMLDKVDGYSIRGEELSLLDEGGAVLARFRAVADSEAEAEADVDVDAE